jgi:serine/threonine protein kinase
MPPRPRSKIVGVGDDGCVVEGRVPSACEFLSQTLPLPISPTDPAIASRLITKVTTKRPSFLKEWEAAHRLARVDPDQSRLLYPLAACETRLAPHGDIAEACDLPPVSDRLFMLQLQRRGRSLKDLVASASRRPHLTPEHAEAIRDDVIEAVALLHAHGWAHGDLHSGNVVIELPPTTPASPQTSSSFAATGRLRAFLIDFAFLKPLDARNEAEDVKDLTDRILLDALSALTPGGKFVPFSARGERVKRHQYTKITQVDVRFVATNPHASPSPARPLFASLPPSTSPSSSGTRRKPRRALDLSQASPPPKFALPDSE